ncbi:MAG: zinc ABC transporter solute-binding protein [Limnothrix sp. RL_2_0]|nr:zinc ABC transporter solute-binding protein [Limnothrix sp. RL_2_0]
MSCREQLPSPEPTATSTIETPVQGDRLNIVVSILPQQYFVEKIGGDKVDVSVMVEAGAEPETYEPKPQQLKALSDADAYISVGIFFEDIWESRFETANSEMAIVNSSTGIDKITMVAHNHDHGHGHDHSAEHSDEEHDHDKEHSDEEHSHEDHDHGAEHSEAGHDEDHDHGAEHSDEEELLDPHTWLSPKKAAVHAENIYATLVELDPSSQAFYQQNLDTFLAEIKQLDADITEILEPLDSRAFLVFHPAWGYFANDYNLEQIAIEVEGQEPSPAELAELIQVAEQEQIRVIFAQYQFNSQSAQTIADEIGAEVVYIDPLATDWAANLKSVAQEIASASQK